MIASTVFDRCLADLNDRLDADQETRQHAAWMNFLKGRYDGPIFCPPARTPAPPAVDWPELHINDAQDDLETMVLEQFSRVSRLLANGAGDALGVRCNYGTGILPSLFGCDLFTMDRETNTLPTAVPLHDGDAVRALLDAGVPDLRTGLGAKVFDCAALFRDVFDRYENIGRFIRLYHPDIQGPIDVAEVVWGSEIFLAFYDEPDLVRNILSLMTETYVAFMRRWYELVPPDDNGTSVHWSWFQNGRLVIRNDSLMNLSPETYVEFVRPCDQRLFDEFGGGVIHYCGRGDHFIAPMSEMTGLTGVNLSQPHLNDMEAIYANTVDKGIFLMGLDPVEAARAADTGRLPNGRVLGGATY